jgi:SpoVK/Ycf46/Vps4 family AAA+-type ATPase
MGYLIAGRIGTGKTFLVQCWAGELGIPCVVFKNFRDRWVGATESNLEKIFLVLRALGQVVVFVDEADQASGRREGGDNDSGLSGRVYAMLAKEMSDTRNRGRIIWVFATSRPDLVEVDLKRQGRLDVHIPLFPPETAVERAALFMAIARKMKVPLAESDLPPLDDVNGLGGHELEGALVRALRTSELAPEPKRPFKEILGEVLREVRASPHTRKLEYMDLVAVSGNFSLRAIASSSAFRSSPVSGGKSGMCTSSRPCRFRSTSSSSGRDVANTQMMRPRLRVSDISLASIE